MDAYPAARVVLVERNIDNWHRSFAKLIDAPYSLSMAIFNILDPAWIGRINKVGYAMVSALTGGRTKQECLDNAKPAYVKHYADIRKAAKDRGIPLLEYRLGEGWQPLCEFLGKPIPRDDQGEEIPFPRMNEEDKLKEIFSAMGKKSLAGAARNASLVIGAVATVAVGIWWAGAHAKLF